MSRLLMVGALLALCGGSELRAQSVAGDWNASMNTPGGLISFGLLLKLSGDTLSGTVRRASGDVPLNGLVKKDSVIFVYTITYNDHPLTMTITSRFAGDSLQGTVDFAGQGSDEFRATRAKAAKPR